MKGRDQTAAVFWPQLLTASGASRVAGHLGPRGAGCTLLGPGAVGDAACNALCAAVGTVVLLQQCRLASTSTEVGGLRQSSKWCSVLLVTVPVTTCKHLAHSMQALTLDSRDQVQQTHFICPGRAGHWIHVLIRHGAGVVICVAEPQQSNVSTAA